MVGISKFCPKKIPIEINKTKYQFLPVIIIKWLSLAYGTIFLSFKMKKGPMIFGQKFEISA